MGMFDTKDCNLMLQITAERLRRNLMSLYDSEGGAHYAELFTREQFAAVVGIAEYMATGLLREYNATDALCAFGASDPQKRPPDT